MSSTSLKIEYLPLADLKPYARNAKKHPRKQIQQIIDSIKEFGFNDPIAIDEKSKVIIEGHGRFEAAFKLELKTVPVIALGHLTEAQQALYRIAHNKLTLNSDFDLDLLTEELKQLLDSSDLDLEMSGFEQDDLDSLLDSVDQGKAERKERLPDLPEQSITKPGEVWALGDHRLACGDSSDAALLERLMRGEQAEMMFTDPPYGVSYSEKNEFLEKYGKSSRITKAIQNDNAGPKETCAFLAGVFANIYPYISPGGAFYVTGPSGPESFEMSAALKEANLHFRQGLVWVKNCSVIGPSDYHYQHEIVFYGHKAGARHRFYKRANHIDYKYYHEPIFYGWKGGAAHRFHPPTGAPRASTWFFTRPMSSKLHPTMKPVAMIEYAIRNSSQAGEIVIDPFAGSGSTLIACESTGRRCRAVEIDSDYCDIIITRWEEFTGRKAERVDE